MLRQFQKNQRINDLLCILNEFEQFLFQFRFICLFLAATMFLGAQLTVLRVHESAGYILIACFAVNLVLQLALEIYRYSRRDSLSAYVLPLKKNAIKINFIPQKSSRNIFLKQ